MNEIELIEQKDLREQYIERIDVLDKVKELLLLPSIDLATTQQVADYYEVASTAIWKIVNRHNDELVEDGYKILNGKEIKKILGTDNMSVSNFRGYYKVDNYKISNNTNGLFPRRSILRVGMLLRDSEVAKEVRTQLLNIEEKTTLEQKVEEINQEQKLVLNIVYGKDEIERANATRELLDYKNRYINILEDKVDTLATGILTWNAREGVNRMVRKIAFKAFDKKFSKAWDKVSAEMLYKHNIGITLRKKNSSLKKPTIFDVLNDNEMKLLVKSCLSLCEMYKIDVDDLFMDINK